MSKDNDNVVIGGWNLPAPYSTHLYELIQLIESEHGLKNGATALYWHLQSVFELHVGKRSESSNV